jgi:hypothetical protein
LLVEQINDQVEKTKFLEKQMTEKNKLLVEQMNDQVEKNKFLEKQMTEKNKLLAEQMNDQAEKNKLLVEQMNDQAEKNKLLVEQMNDQVEKNKFLEKQMTEKNKLFAEQMNDQVEKYKLLEEQMKVQIEKCKLLEEHLNSLNIKVDKLENIHRGIYFRDISKFYIDTFCQNNNIKGDDTYHRAENLLKMDYKNNLKDYKQTMCEIAQHYKEGYNIAHMEYFIKKFNNKTKLK